MEKENFESKFYKFDAFLTKTIIYSSANYSRKEVKKNNIELNLIDNENYLGLTNVFRYYDNIEIDNPKDFILLCESEKISKALRELSDIELCIIVMFFYHNMSLQEISRKLNINYKSVSRIKLRALNKIKNKLEVQL